jgi:type II secretory pathway pseudopilin PulG
MRIQPRRNDHTRRDQRGTTLVEIVIALVILGGLVSTLLAALATASQGSKAHRDLVTADAALRDYAEAAKAAVKLSCAGAGGTATYTVSYTPPAGFTVNSLGTRTCPASTSVSQLDLSVTLPSGTVRSLSIKVRSA